MFGLPGTGKGTLAARISIEMTIEHISCGDVFRRHVVEGTRFGKLARRYIEAGRLTPDEETSRMFLEHLALLPEKRTYLIEGFPRTTKQADAFERHLLETGRRIEAALLLEAASDQIVERLRLRRVCSKCGRIFNLRFAPPTIPDVCDTDAGPLVRRADDKEELIRPRLALYKEHEDALVAFYSERNRVHRVDASRDANAVFDNVRELLWKPD